MPLVSVIIPTYRRPGMLREAVESVLSQSFSDYELIVVDDGSGDETSAVLERYSGRLKYFVKKNGGVASARNFGLRVASGDLVAWLDDDDLFLPGKLWLQVEYFRSYPGAGLVYTGHETLDTLGSRPKVSLYLPPAFRDCCSTRAALLKSCFFANSTVMMKRECFDLAGLFDESLKHTVDYDQWLRTAARYSFGCVPRVLMRYRLHGKQITMRRDKKILPVLRSRARDLYSRYPCREVV